MGIGYDGRTEEEIEEENEEENRERNPKRKRDAEVLIQELDEDER